MCAWRRCLWAQHPLASVALKLEGFLKHQKCCQVAHLVGKSGRSSCRRRCLRNPSNYLLNKKLNAKDNETVVNKLDDDKYKWWCSKSIVHFSQQSVSPHHSQVSHKKFFFRSWKVGSCIFVQAVTCVTRVTSGLDPSCEKLVASVLDVIITTSNFPQGLEVWHIDLKLSVFHQPRAASFREIHISQAAPLAWNHPKANIQHQSRLADCAPASCQTRAWLIHDRSGNVWTRNWSCPFLCLRCSWHCRRIQTWSCPWKVLRMDHMDYVDHTALPHFPHSKKKPNLKLR